VKKFVVPAVLAVSVASAVSVTVVLVAGEWERLDQVMDRSVQEQGSVLDLQP